jgi:hypothetical protein
MFDVFYSGVKPNLFVHEREAASIEQACELSRTRYFWWVNYLTDYTNFDFLFEPVPWQQHQRHAFASQWQKDSGTYLISKNGYQDTNYHASPILTRLPDDTNWIVPANVDVTSFDFSWHPDATDPPFIYQFGTQWQKTGGPQYIVSSATEVKYVDQIKINASQVATAIYEIDHLDNNTGKITNVTKTVRYFDNYLDTLKRLVKHIPDEHEFVWICSSVCDYTNFDFTWHPEVWQGSMLHVFPSDNEKFGDTFFMHVPTFKYRCETIQLLEWYDLNFMNISVPRRPLPVIKHNFDTHVDAVKKLDFPGPIAIFTTQDLPNIKVPAVNLWREKVKTIIPLSAGASICVVPKVSVPYVKTQLYDYPNILRTHRNTCTESPLDIIFVSNGEPGAEYNWQWLENSILDLKDNRLARVDRVKGRVAAHHACARKAKTDWYFLVPAKLQINLDFDWTWQPDRMQQPKHYIFHAKNSVNGLEYGHMAMIAMNKKLVLENTGQGLDFSLDQLHEVVPILSGNAHYAESPAMCWRTAFREVLKLKAALPDIEAEYRLDRWLKVADVIENSCSIWSIYGAEDAVEYYEAVDGNFDDLKKSYEWDWLTSYALIKRGLAPD